MFPRHFVSNFGQTVWNWFKVNENSSQRRMHTSHSFKIAPPFFKSWLRACMNIKHTIIPCFPTYGSRPKVGSHKNILLGCLFFYCILLQRVKFAEINNKKWLTKPAEICVFRKKRPFFGLHLTFRELVWEKFWLSMGRKISHIRFFSISLSRFEKRLRTTALYIH